MKMSANIMQELAKYIASKLGKKYGFFLMVYEHGDGNGRSNYVSNSDRKDVVKAMQEFIEKTEDSWGAHKINDQPVKSPYDDIIIEMVDNLKNMPIDTLLGIYEGGTVLPFIQQVVTNRLSELSEEQLKRVNAVSPIVDGVDVTPIKK